MTWTSTDLLQTSVLHISFADTFWMAGHLLVTRLRSPCNRTIIFFSLMSSNKRNFAQKGPTRKCLRPDILIEEESVPEYDLEDFLTPILGIS